MIDADWIKMAREYSEQCFLRINSSERLKLRQESENWVCDNFPLALDEIERLRERVSQFAKAVDRSYIHRPRDPKLQMVFCIHCKGEAWLKGLINHKEDCIVLKARHYLDKEGE
jgi:hypothetical protein